jgi:hypothetical protein
MMPKATRRWKGKLATKSIYYRPYRFDIVVKKIKILGRSRTQLQVERN